MNLRTLTITEAHRETGIPRAQLYTLLETGKLAGNRTGRTWRISAQSLEAFVTARRGVPVAVEVEHVEDVFA